jgi:gamma-glutamylputrescine oxidase
VAGGFRDQALEAENTAEEATTPLSQGHLDRFVQELTGASPQITHRWTGILGTTPDRRPLVGTAQGTKGVWVSAGYSGHGNVMGLACGELVARAILGQGPPELELFEPARLLAV